MSWDAIKRFLRELEDVLIRLAILISVGFVLFELLHSKLMDLIKHL